MIMKTAPLGAFGAMAFTIGSFGVGTLAQLAGLMACFYLTCLLFIVVVLGKHQFAGGRPEMPGDLTREIGQAVLTRYVLPFELLAVLMLAGMLTSCDAFCTPSTASLSALPGAKSKDTVMAGIWPA